MTGVKDGGPAFPVADQGVYGTYGMSLRDYFAGQALIGVLANPGTRGTLPEDTFEMIYALADRMLIARNETPKT